MQKGTVFDIQRFCVHDGPGIRTTVFLKGCSMHCFWCHNPESICAVKQLMFFEEKCICCSRCIEVCMQHAHSVSHGVHVFDRKLCSSCGKCAKECAANALVMSGEEMTAEQVMEEVLKDLPFYQTSGGGVTFSGGEPLLQVDFLETLLRACRQNGLHTAVETAGNVEWECFRRILDITDLFLYDIKVMNPIHHREVTGKDNQKCLENLRRLDASGKKIVIRVPVIPDINDSEEAILEIAEFVSNLQGKHEIELLAFHKMGKKKYEALGLDYKAEHLQSPDEGKLKRLRNVIAAYPKSVGRKM